MKKITAIILVLVLVIAMSTVAFAAEGVGTQTNVGTTNAGITKVTVEVNSQNLSVTVPISMTIVAPVAGGDCTVPNTYAIVNKSALAVKVTGIQVTDPEGGLTFSNTEPTATVANKDKVSIALKPSGDLSAVQLTTDAIVTGLGGFDMAAATNETGVSKAIAITAKSGMLGSTEQQADAFTITFTVAAGTSA